MTSTNRMRLGPFYLKHLIGKGATGDVWCAVHETLLADETSLPTPQPSLSNKANTTGHSFTDRDLSVSTADSITFTKPLEVAIKFIRSEENPISLSINQAYEELLAEARAAAGLNHRHAIHVLDFGIVSEHSTSESLLNRYGPNTPYLLMEYAPGERWLDFAGKLQWSQQKTIILQLLDVLSHAHGRGLIHRDIKPEKGLICDPLSPNIRSILLDFGLAQVISETTVGDQFVAGTPAYMSPEQLLGEWRNLGPQSDLYSFGCTVWRILSNQAPFGNNLGYQHLAISHIRNQLPVLENSIPIPSKVVNWLHRLLEKSATDRFDSAAEAKASLLNIGDICDLPVQSNLASESTAMIPKRSILEKESFAPTSSIRIISLPIAKKWTEHPESIRPAHLRGVGLNLFPHRSFPLVGRIPERDMMWELIHRTHQKGAQCLCLSGPSGTGKTRLAHWLGTLCREAGNSEILNINYSNKPSPKDGILSSIIQYLRCTHLSGDALTTRLNQVFSYSKSLQKLIPQLLQLSSEFPSRLKSGSGIRYFCILLRHLPQTPKASPSC